MPYVYCPFCKLKMLPVLTSSNDKNNNDDDSMMPKLCPYDRKLYYNANNNNVWHAHATMNTSTKYHYSIDAVLTVARYIDTQFTMLCNEFEKSIKVFDDGTDTTQSECACRAHLYEQERTITFGLRYLNEKHEYDKLQCVASHFLTVSQFERFVTKSDADHAYRNFMKHNTDVYYTKIWLQYDKRHDKLIGLFRGVIEGRVSPVLLRNIGIRLIETKPVSPCNQEYGHDLAMSSNMIGTNNDFGDIAQSDVICSILHF